MISLCIFRTWATTHCMALISSGPGLPPFLLYCWCFTLNSSTVFLAPPPYPTSSPSLLHILKDGDTALILVSDGNNIDIVKLLLDAGANINAKGEVRIFRRLPALFVSIGRGSRKVGDFRESVKISITQVLHPSCAQSTFLHCVAFRGLIILHLLYFPYRLFVCDYLFELNQGSPTALSNAAASGNAAIVQFLLKYGKSRDIKIHVSLKNTYMRINLPQVTEFEPQGILTFLFNT